MGPAVGLVRSGIQEYFRRRARESEKAGVPASASAKYVKYVSKTSTIPYAGMSKAHSLWATVGSGSGSG